MPLPMGSFCKQTAKGGCRSIPLHRSRPLSRRSGCFPVWGHRIDGQNSEGTEGDNEALGSAAVGRVLRTVYHGENGLRTLREFARSYQVVGKDLMRVMNRIKALYRSWGIPCAGTQVYTRRHRDLWLNKIQEAGVHRRAELFYQELDGLMSIAAHCAKRTARREPETSSSETAAPDSFHRPAAGRAAGGLDADAAPVPEQAAAVDL
jgi:hypothetical protein